MKLISNDQALSAIVMKEFSDDIIRSADHVAVILTQSWCPQWHAMKRFVTEFSAAEVYFLEYDRSDCFAAFREFKEKILGNDQIPYIRYYLNGVLTGVSNAVTEDAFTEKLGLPRNS